MGFFSKLFDDILGFDPPKAPPLPPLPPPAIQIDRADGPASEEIRKRRRTKASGRRKTIVTGDLTPEDPGRTNLLGRPA